MIFSISETGSSHLPKNIPCQDFSTHYESADGSVKIAIVCDGHGEACCCRSDRGSFFAAKACKDKVLDALEKLGPYIAGKAGAVTTKPAGIDQLWGKQKLDLASELYHQLQEQGVQYNMQAQNFVELELFMRRLFQNIRDSWLEYIRHDLSLQNFSEKEKAALGNRPPERAYGTTLMCYVQTRKFWFAFQVGDGRLLVADPATVQNDAVRTDSAMLNWRHPVPWDCRCFMNHTTSLCGEDAVEQFRYAFDGTGNFPAAAICCSDGVEDSFGDYESAPQGLHGFFTQVVTGLQADGVTDTCEKLQEALPEISRLRSHDDMSLACVVN